EFDGVRDPETGVQQRQDERPSAQLRPQLVSGLIVIEPAAGIEHFFYLRLRKRHGRNHVDLGWSQLIGRVFEAPAPNETETKKRAYGLQLFYGVRRRDLVLDVEVVEVGPCSPIARERSQIEGSHAPAVKIFCEVPKRSPVTDDGRSSELARTA